MTQVDKREVSVYQFAEIVQAEAFYAVADKDPADRIELDVNAQQLRELTWSYPLAKEEHVAHRYSSASSFAPSSS